MRIVTRPFPIPPRRRDAAFIADQRLRGMVLRMISLNSLGAFAQEIARRPTVVEPAARGGVPATAPAQDASGLTTPVSATAAQRSLEAVPPQPARPLPRGSLLDLRV